MTHQPARSREQSVPMVFERAGLAALRVVVAGLGRTFGLTGTGLDGLVLAVNEIATNAVVHGAGRGWLRLWYESDRLYAEVSDEGTGLPPGYVVRPAGVSERSGRGLWLASQFCDLSVRPASPRGTAVQLSIVCPSGRRDGR